ncbi:MAG: hypothetical protein CML05_18395 [Pseudozobellia sp.]|nr:hypothetical protein [Pseudozobellia sp.]MBG50259.1 hypothetical protein [Pseudozobellia sp.]|tara:strand:+ start:4157 stop:4834 length:678 start_codon:yes stop_codon:yes gene_type:complete
MNHIYKILLLTLLCLIFSCDSDSTSGEEPQPEPTEQTPDISEEEEEEEEETDENSGEGENEGENTESEEQENDDNDDGAALGVIQLSGEETSEVGTSLTVGHIDVGREDLTGTIKSVILTDENTPITEEGPEPANLNNGFILIGGDDLDTVSNDGALKDISMIIFIDGKEYRFACSVPSGTFIDCGEKYDIDFENKTMVFDSTTVANTETQKVLILDGSISWTEE